jgi:hypothetical protein
VAADLAQARRVKQQLVQRYSSIAEVNGVGIVRRDDGWAVKVNLERPVPNLSVPDSIDGVAVFTDVVGSITAR